MTEQNRPMLKDTRHIKEIAGGVYSIELIGTSDLEIKELGDLYELGFGDHLPMSADEHRKMAFEGDTIGIREKSSGKLIAMRAMVYEKKQSNPLDTRIERHHAYQNHTVIDPKFRGVGLIHELTSVAQDVAVQKNKTAILTCTAVDNSANLKALTRLGYQISDFAPDHFGPEEDRYMLEKRFDSEYLRQDAFYKSLLDSGLLKVDSPDLLSPIIAVHASNIAASQTLIEKGYRGTRAVTHNGELILLFEHQDFMLLGQRIRTYCFSNDVSTLDISKNQLVQNISKFSEFFRGNTQMEHELTIAKHAIEINITHNRTQTLARIYQLTYSIEDRAGTAPTVLNGLLPALADGARSEFADALNMSVYGSVILLGCSTIGSLRGAEKIAETIQGTTTVVDFDDTALMMLNRHKSDGTDVQKVDLTAVKEFPHPFDIAITDYVHSFIPRKKWWDFMNNISTWVKPYGYYIGAVYVYDKLLVDSDEIARSGSYRRERVMNYLIESEGIEVSLAGVVGDLLKYRHMQVFPSERTTENNFHGAEDVTKYLADGGFTVQKTLNADLPHISGTGLRRLVFIAKKNS